MKAVKVLLVVTLSEVGGAQKVVYHLAAGLDARSFDVTVACAPGGELVNWLRKLPRHVNIVEIPELKRNISPLNDWRSFLKLYFLIRRGNFDVVHCHSSKAGILGRFAAWLSGVKRIYFTAHGWGINNYQSRPARFVYTWLERFAGAVSTKVVCVSEYDLSRARTLKLVSDNKLFIIHNGLPSPKVGGGLLRKELCVRDEDIIIGMIARLAPPKAPLFFLEVASRMISKSNYSSEKHRTYFVLIGDGPMRAECEDFVITKGLKGRVFLLGTREEAAELLQDFDILALFSRWEGLPLTIIEAMLAGKPVVANSVGGVGELVIHQKTGFLINNLDLEAAGKALQGLISSMDDRLSMGQMGRWRACELFNISKMIDQYRALYLS